MEVVYCGVCGSDLHEYASQAPSLRAAGMFQPVMGHEFTGTVSALGEAVNGLAVGDPVVVHPGGPCGQCYFCQSGAANQRLDLRRFSGLFVSVIMKDLP